MGSFFIRNGTLSDFLGDASGNLLVSLNTALSSAIDSIDVAKMTKGAVTTAHSSAIASGTSAEISAVGFNGLGLEINALGTATGTVDVFGVMVTGGTVGLIYDEDGVQMQGTVGAAGVKVQSFKGIPDYIKTVLTRGGGTFTVKVQPMNL